MQHTKISATTRAVWHLAGFVALFGASQAFPKAAPLICALLAFQAWDLVNNFKQSGNNETQTEHRTPGPQQID